MDAVIIGERWPSYYEVRGTRSGVRAQAGDVLFARITPCLENGKLAQVPSGTERVGGSTEFIVVRPGDLVDSGYLYFWCMEPSVRSKAKSLMAGATGRLRLGAADLGQFQIPLPPLDVQRRIVEVLEDHLSRLDAADAYVQSATQHLASAERSTLDRLFGGRDVPLADLVDSISAGKSFGTAKASAADDEWGIIKVSAMTWGQFDPAENKAVPGDSVDPRFEIREGDLLVSRANTGEYVGASVLVGPVRPKLLLSDKSLRLAPAESVRPDWLWRALQAPSARGQISALATGTKDSMRNISQASLMRVRVPRATPQEQAAAVSAYAEFVLSADRLRSGLNLARRRSVGLRRSLLAAAFSGQLVAEMATV
jgi:type I restriction enzyme S subunit